MNTIPKDILIHILSFTSLKDTNAISRVCKLWNSVLEIPKFWEKRIIEYINGDRPHDFCFLFKPILLKHNFFIGDMNFLTVRDRLEFLFNKDLISYRSGQFVCITNQRENRLQRIDLNDNTIYHEQIYKLARRDGVVRVYLNNVESPLKSYMFFEKNKKRSKLAICFFKYENGVTFKGESLLTVNTDDMKPHGKGTWRFPDGSVITGDNVAKHGVCNPN